MEKERKSDENNDKVKDKPENIKSGTGPKKDMARKPGEEITDEPVGEDIPTREQPGEQGCIRCIADPKATGDLANQFDAGSPTLLVPCGDKTWHEQIQYVIDWKNSDGADIGYNENYKKQAGDTTAYKSVETFDELISIIQRATGAAVTLPQILTTGGVKQIDNILRELRDRTAVFLFGKKDMEILRGDVEWDFELRTNSKISVYHNHRIEGFAQRPGLWDFTVEVAIEDELEKLRLLSEKDRKDLIEPPPTSSSGSATTPSGGSASTTTTPDPGGLSKSTNGKKYFPVSDTISLKKGQHTVTSAITLLAGYRGIFDEDAINEIKETLKKVEKAIQDLINAANEVISATSTGQVAQNLQTALSSAADAAVSILTSLLKIFNKLLDEAIGYIKLYRSILRLECVHE